MESERAQLGNCSNPDRNDWILSYSGAEDKKAKLQDGCRQGLTDFVGKWDMGVRKRKSRQPL